MREATNELGSGPDDSARLLALLSSALLPSLDLEAYEEAIFNVDSLVHRSSLSEPLHPHSETCANPQPSLSLSHVLPSEILIPDHIFLADPTRGRTRLRGRGRDLRTALREGDAGDGAGKAANGDV